MAGALGSLPSTGTILGGGAAGTGNRQRRPQQPGAQPQQFGSGQQGGQPQTFQQMQQQGMARPAPPQPQQVAQQQANTGQQVSQQGGIGNQLQGAVSNALATPSRYDLPQVQQVQQALTNQLQQQFGAQKKQLDEQMAARGLSASSIGAGYYGDLAGQQANALANMNAQLIQNQASTSAADQAASLGAGQNYQNSQLAQQLGLGNLGVAQQQANTGQQSVANQYALGQGQLGISAGQLTGQYGGQQTLGAQLGLGQLGLSQGALTGTYGGNQTLEAQKAAAQNALDVGGLTGNYLGGNTLGAQQLQQGGQQFQQNLAQQLGIAQMQDYTQNQGIQAQNALAKNQLLYQVLGSLGGLDPAQLQQMFQQFQNGGSSGGGTGGTGGGGTGGGTGGSGTGGGTDGGTGGGGLYPPIPGGPSSNLVGARMSTQPYSASVSPAGGGATVGGGSQQQQGTYQFPQGLFGGSPYSGQFGNAGYQTTGGGYQQGGSPWERPIGAQPPVGGQPPLGGAGGTGVGLGDQVQQILGGGGSPTMPAAGTPAIAPDANSISRDANGNPYSATNPAPTSAYGDRGPSLGLAPGETAPYTQNTTSGPLADLSKYPGLSPQLAALFGVTTSSGQTPMGSANQAGGYQNFLSQMQTGDILNSPALAALLTPEQVAQAQANKQKSIQSSQWWRGG